MADESDDPMLDTLWERALAAWEDDRKHAALLDHALRAESLPEIAGRYRALVDDPVKGAAARKRIDAIVAAATQMLLSTKTPPAVRVPLPIALTAMAVCALLLGWIALVVWGKR